MSNNELEGAALLCSMENRIAELEQQRSSLIDTCARLICTITEIRLICDEAIVEKSNAAAVVVGLAKATKDILSEIQGVKK